MVEVSICVRLCGSDVGQLGFATELALAAVGVCVALSIHASVNQMVEELTHDHDGGLDLD